MDEKKKHILIVDDNDDIRNPLARYFSDNNMRVSKAAHSNEARQVLKSTLIDLIILDIMMPGDDGFTLCKEIREKSEIPIIFLSAKIDDIDRILGLEFGGDDYITKPFNPRELLARVHAVLKRVSGMPNQIAHPENIVYAFGEWTFNMLHKELVNDEGIVTILSDMESRLLCAFLRAPQKTLTRIDLLRSLHGNNKDSVFDRAIDTQVSRLRKKLTKSKQAKDYINTVWGTGYIFIADVRSL